MKVTELKTKTDVADFINGSANPNEEAARYAINATRKAGFNGYKLQDHYKIHLNELKMFDAKFDEEEAMRVCCFMEFFVEA